MALCGAPYTFSIRDNQQDINAIERQIDRSKYNPLFAINKTSDILDYYLQFQSCRDFKEPRGTTLTGYRKCIKRNIFSPLDNASLYALCQCCRRISYSLWKNLHKNDILYTIFISSFLISSISIISGNQPDCIFLLIFYF